MSCDDYASTYNFSQSKMVFRSAYLTIYALVKMSSIYQSKTKQTTLNQINKIGPKLGVDWLKVKTQEKIADADYCVTKHERK